jgi:hypothetical protein
MKQVRADHPGANIVNSNPQNVIPNPNVIYNIPVVVHVLWNTAGQNISDAQIQSQIDVLNEDYARMNADAVNTPGAFASFASSTNFRFCLATTDPTGNPTNGIERRQTSQAEYQTDDRMKHYNNGGLNAWDVDRYLNIWVCNLADDILGYAETPDMIPHTNTFGVVIAYNAFGRMGTATSPYHLGRTATHEIGHCFNLIHIWGDDNGSCGGLGDRVADTPDQSSETFNCVNFPKLDTCSNTYPGIMFMNYMDYSDDACMNLFTAGQAIRMYNEINAYYPSLIVSTACGNVGVNELSSLSSFNIYPNPSSGHFTAEFAPGTNNVHVELINSFGQILFSSNPEVSRVDFDLSSYPAGLYFVRFSDGKASQTKPVVVE